MCRLGDCADCVKDKKTTWRGTAATTSKSTRKQFRYDHVAGLDDMSSQSSLESWAITRQDHRQSHKREIAAIASGNKSANSTTTMGTVDLVHILSAPPKFPRKEEKQQQPQSSRSPMSLPRRDSSGRNRKILRRSSSYQDHRPRSMDANTGGWPTTTATAATATVTTALLQLDGTDFTTPVPTNPPEAPTHARNRDLHFFHSPQSVMIPRRRSSPDSAFF